MVNENQIAPVIVSRNSLKLKPSEIRRMAHIIRSRPDLQLEGLSRVVHIAIEEWCEAQEKRIDAVSSTS